MRAPAQIVKEAGFGAVAAIAVTSHDYLGVLQLRKFVLVLTAALLVISSVFDNAVSAQSAVADSGLVATGGKEHVLGGGVVMTIPEGWALRQNPTLFAMKDFGQWDYRLRTAPVSIALTGVGFPLPKDHDASKARSIDTEELLRKGMQQYLANATETSIAVVAFGSGRVAGHYATLRAKDGAVFPIGFDAPRRCVTSAIVMAGIYEKKLISYTITIGSDDCTSPAHTSAVAAVAGIRGVTVGNNDRKP